MLNDEREATPMMRNETTNIGITKVLQFNWSMKDQPGRLCWINKDDLKVDHAYQRNAQNHRVLSIAQNWSWLSCGVIIVAVRREKNKMQCYVVDGQHRVLAALKRSDIEALPCLAFAVNDVSVEAAGFIDANAGRRMPTSREKWRAQILRGDDATVFCNMLVEQSGRLVSNFASAGTVRCLTSMLRAAAYDREKLERIWPLVVEVCEGQILHERIFDGMFYIETRLPKGQSMTDRRWRDRVKDVGYEALLEGAQRAATFFTKGGPKVWATGMLEVINKGRRTVLALHDDAG